MNDAEERITALEAKIAARFQEPPPRVHDQAAIDKMGEVSHAVMTHAEYAALSPAQQALVARIKQHAGWYPVVLHHHRDILAARHGSSQEVSVEDTPNWETLLDDISFESATAKKRGA